jgi:hypothetical protein
MAWRRREGLEKGGFWEFEQVLGLGNAHFRASPSPTFIYISKPTKSQNKGKKL